MRRLAVAAAVLLCLIGGLSLIEATGVTRFHTRVIRIFTPDGTLVIMAYDPGVKVTIEGDGGIRVTGAGLEEIHLRPGVYKVTADRDGKNARRLTSDLGVESYPVFSPDGTIIAFSAQYDGNTDVYTIPTDGGTPTRLTYHPGSDIVRGFTPDGKEILFSSPRNVYTNRHSQLFTVPLAGGMPLAYAGTMCLMVNSLTGIPYPLIITPSIPSQVRVNGMPLVRVGDTIPCAPGILTIIGPPAMPTLTDTTG